MADSRPMSPCNPRRLITAALALSIGVITFACFVPAVHGEFLKWDDEGSFLNNTDYRGLGWENIRWMFTTFHMGHYQPAAWLTLGWDWVVSAKLFGEDPAHGLGMDPRPYHVTN